MDWSTILKGMFFGACFSIIMYESEEDKLIKQLKKLSPAQMDKLISDGYKWLEENKQQS